MNSLVKKVIETLLKRELIPPLPDSVRSYVPVINRVELYPTFKCNDRCAHCITNSGPRREETLSPGGAVRALGNVAGFTIIERLKYLFGEGEFQSKSPRELRELERMEKPPFISWRPRWNWTPP